MLKIHKKLIIGLAFVGGVALILYLSKQISIPKMESGGDDPFCSIRHNRNTKLDNQQKVNVLI